MANDGTQSPVIIHPSWHGEYSEDIPAAVEGGGSGHDRQSRRALKQGDVTSGMNLGRGLGA